MTKKPKPVTGSANRKDLPRGPLFQNDRAAKEKVLNAARSKPSEETVRVLSKEWADAHEKIGWAKTEAGRSESSRDRQYYEQRQHSATATTAIVSPLLTEHQTRLSQSKKAQRRRPNALRDLVLDFLREHPLAKTPQVIRHLRNLEGNGVIENIVGDTIEWADRKRRVEIDDDESDDDGRAKSTTFAQLTHVVGRCRKELRKK